MAFCPNCGTQVAGSFCQNCGTAMPGAAAAGAAPSSAPGGSGAGYQASNTAYQNQPPLTVNAGMSDNVASALCYLAGLITGIIFLVVAPYNQNKAVRFNAFQSIFAHLAVIVIFWGLLIVTHGFGFFLMPLLMIGIFILWLYMMYSAFNGKKVKLPVIGDLAEKQA